MIDKKENLLINNEILISYFCIWQVTGAEKTIYLFSFLLLYFVSDTCKIYFYSYQSACIFITTINEEKCIGIQKKINNLFDIWQTNTYFVNLCNLRL